MSANSQSFNTQWFRTGDEGYFDDEGFLFLTGRLKEIINRGGEKISPCEVDDKILEHPKVEQAVTFSIPHDLLGEDIAAAVVLKNGVNLTEIALKQFLKEKLTKFKIPRTIFFVAEIPKGPTGKIQRIGLAKKLGVS